MSLVAPSPLSSRPKRALDEYENNEPGFQQQSVTSILSKRARYSSSPAHGRCAHPSFDTFYSVSPTALAAVLNLFPEMDEKLVTDVLAECGNNIDAAIQKLTDLKLSADPSNPVQPAVPADAAATNQQAGPVDVPASSGPQTGEQWVDYLVTELAAARDLATAKGKTGSILQQFEAFVSARSKTEANAKLTELQRENQILKKAVQIQHTKLQEKAHQEQELQQLKGMIAQYQEQVRTLELTNYSLTMHLQQATSTNRLHSHRGPDVF